MNVSKWANIIGWHGDNHYSKKKAIKGNSSSSFACGNAPKFNLQTVNFG